MFFFFKQKTAYEMRISDWSSDVCSSDLFTIHGLARRPQRLADRGDSAVLHRQFAFLQRASKSVAEANVPDQQIMHAALSPIPAVFPQARFGSGRHGRLVGLMIVG